MNYETPLTDPISITNGLSLTPRIKLLLTVFRADAAVASLDEWKFKRAFFDFLNSSFSLPITVADDDLLLRRVKDVKNRKRDDPVATGSLLVRDLGFVKDSAAKVRDVGGDGNDVVGLLEREFREWRKELVGKMDGMEVSLEGVKFRVWVRVPVSDDFELMKKEWEEYYVLGISRRGYQRGGRQEPDTIILRGVPSRWFAEPRVSSKPSMLVTHTIFSTFGKIRNLNVAEDDYLGKDTDNDTEDIVSGLQCKIVVQFEKHRDFYNTLKVLCGRSLQKEGSRLRADYEVTWDKDGFFEDARRRTQEMSSRVSALASLSYRHEGPRRLSYTSRYSPDNARAKRLKE